MARQECDYCDIADIKAYLGAQWTSGVAYDALLGTLVTEASRLIDRETGWRDCHYAADELAIAARLYDTRSGYETEIDRFLNDGLYYTAITISFTAPNLIIDAVAGLAGFVAGDVIAVSGSATVVAGLRPNDTVYTVTLSVAGQLTVTPATIVAEAAGASVTISRPAVAVDETVSGLYIPWAGNVDYITQPYNETYFTRIQIRTGAAKVFPTGQQLLQVTGHWGGHAAPPPRVVKIVTIMTVARWFKEGMQAYQDTGAIIEVGQLVYRKALGPAVKEMLRVTARRAPYG